MVFDEDSGRGGGCVGEREKGRLVGGVGWDSRIRRLIGYEREKRGWKI